MGARGVRAAWFVIAVMAALGASPWAAGSVASAAPARAAASGIVAGNAAPQSLDWLSHVAWTNVAPLTASQLRGRVVIVEFWTFECVNCLRTVPAMRALHDRYARGDVLLIGVHSPELEHERSAAALREAIQRLGLRFPVAQDNDFAAWNAFGNQYWPALYVLDRQGRVRQRHMGELHLGTPAFSALIATIEALRREPA